MIEAVALTTDHCFYHTPHHPWFDPLRSSHIIHTLRRIQQDIVHTDGGAAGAVHLHVTDGEHHHIRPAWRGLVTGERRLLVILLGDVHAPVAGARTSEEVSRTCVEKPAKAHLDWLNIILCKPKSAIKIR